MAITHFLLESKFSSNSLLQQPKWSSAHKNKNTLRSYSCNNANRTSPKFRVDCLISTNRKPAEVKSINNLEKIFATDHTEVIIWRSLKSVVKALQKPVITFILFGFLFLCHHRHGYVALAASGGRMGGRSSSSSRRSSSSSRRSSSSSRRSSSSSGRSSSSSGTSGSGSHDHKEEVEWEPKEEHVIFFRVLLSLPIIWCICGLARILWNLRDKEHKTSVVKIQVGLMGSARSLQRKLDEIAKTADTSTPKGYRYIFQETITALLQHPDYWISGHFSVDVKESLNEGEKKFDKLSLEERSKFDEETLVNVDNVKKQSPTIERTDGIQNEYIVVTVIVVADGVHEQPPIESSAELKKALEKMASIPSCKIMAAEVLWTPQQENDTLSEKKMLEDYPLLRPL